MRGELLSSKHPFRLRLSQLKKLFSDRTDKKALVQIKKWLANKKIKKLKKILINMYINITFFMVVFAHLFETDIKIYETT